eukprot:1162456-Rhodomonas_salina.2
MGLTPQQALTREESSSTSQFRPRRPQTHSPLSFRGLPDAGSPLSPCLHALLSRTISFPIAVDHQCGRRLALSVDNATRPGML